MKIHRRLPWPVLQDVLTGALIAGTAVLSRFLLEIPAAPGRAGLAVMVYASAAVFALLLFHPAPRGSLAATLAWCAAVTALVIALVAADPVTRQLAEALPGLAVTVFLLSATLLLIQRRLPSPSLPALFVLATFLPMWAAPLVEATGNTAWLTALVVNASPLTVIAAALEFDYLRSGWFYATSALGSLRYEYVPWRIFCAALATLPVAAVITSMARTTRSTAAGAGHAGEFDSSSANSPARRAPTGPIQTGAGAGRDGEPADDDRHRTPAPSCITS